MPNILTVQLPLLGLLGGVVGCTGVLRRYRHGVHTFPVGDLRQIKVPTGTGLVLRRPSWQTYNSLQRSRIYGVGAFSHNILVDENLRCLRQGIPAPTVVPTLAAGAGTGITGACIIYYRFKDTIGQRVGPLSAPSNTVTLANQDRVAGNVPTSCLDPSVDAVQMLVSMAGAAPRVAWERQFGPSSVTDNVATGDLGEAAIDTFREMPLGLWNVIYGDAQWIGGNEQFPERVFRSNLGEPEQFGGLFVQTDGERAVGAFTHNDQLYFGSPKSIYRVTGFEGSDLTREVEKPDIGLVGHFGHVAVHRRVIVVTTVGFQLFDGSWHQLTDDRQSEFVREYKAFRADYEAAQGYYDPIRNVYVFGPVRHTEYPFLWTKWVLDGARLFPELESSDFGKAWATDARFREDATSAVLTLPSGGEPYVVTGGKDGSLREEGYAEDSTDDGDGHDKTWVIEPPTLKPSMTDGGNDSDGAIFHKAWNHMQCAGSPDDHEWTASFRVGTENARVKAEPDFEDVTLADDSEVQDEEPSSNEPHVLEGCAGEALNMVITEPHASANLCRWRGYGGVYGPGIKRRGGPEPGDPG